MGSKLLLRVGDDVCIPHSCRCDGRMDRRGSRGFSCNYSAGHFPRHSAMNDVVKGVSAQGATTRATSEKIVACRSRCRFKIWVYAQAPCVRGCDK